MKDIPWYEWLYAMTEDGKVWSYPKYWRKIWRYLKQQRRWEDLRFHIDICFYWKIKSHKVSRLMWKTFLWLIIEDKNMLVCHKDDNPDNNHMDNLFLWTHKDNSQDMVKKWRQWWFKNRWENNWMSKLSYDDLIWIKKLLSDWVMQKEIAKKYKCSNSNISNIKTWKRHIEY